MNLEKYLKGNRKNIIIGTLMLISFFILLPNFVKFIGDIMAPYTDDDVVITTVSYTSEGLPEGENNIIVGNLYQPSPKFSDKEYPAVIACHGWLMGFGKESMHRWCVEVAKRGFVVLSLDLPGSGMSMGEMDMFPRNDFEPRIIADGIQFLKGYVFVDGSKIGLMGISYGGATVSMAAGVLGNKIDATVAMNGFTNTTNWLIEGILPESDVDFEVNRDSIEIKKIGDNKVTKDNIKDFLRLYSIVRGDERLIEDLIIDGTNKLDRDFLKKFDAVKYLDQCKNGSVLFIHSSRDGTFDKTNQSGQAYEAILKANKSAHYILVDDNHQLMDDPEYTSDYCIINFLEEKLKGEELGEDWDSDYEKYSQERDIELTASKTFGFETMYISLGVFFLSLIPAFFIFSIIIYNKKIAQKRAKKEEIILKRLEEDEEYIDYSFGRGSYLRMAIFLALSYFFAYLGIIGLGLGLFSEIMAGFFTAAFYLVLFLALYHLPDKAEIEVWNRLKNRVKVYPAQEQESRSKIFDINALMPLFLVLLLTIIAAIAGALFSPLPPVWRQPLEPIFRTMLITGSLLLIGGIFMIYRHETRVNEGIQFTQIDWDRYDLATYRIAKSFTFGTALFLNFIFQYNIWAFYMKFPSIIGPHTVYYIFMVLAVLIFYAGVNLILKIVKETTFKDNVDHKERTPMKGLLTVLLETLAIAIIFAAISENLIIRIGGIIISGVIFSLILYRVIKKKYYLALIDFLTFILGICLIALLTFIAFYPLLNTALFGNLTGVIFILLSAIFILTSLFQNLCNERGIFGVPIFVPLAIFTIIAFLFHF